MRFEQPATESRASSRGLMMSRAMPVRASTRARNSSPFSAERQAWVAMARRRTGSRRRTLSAQTLSAANARSMAASESRPEALSPSPSRTIRE